MRGNRGKLTAAAVILGVIAGCSSAAAPPPSAGTLAKRIGCHHWTPTLPPGLYTRTEGGCTLPGGSHVVLATFNTSDGESAWLQAEASLGGVIVKGTGWGANADTAADARMVAGRLGGQVTR